MAKLDTNAAWKEATRLVAANREVFFVLGGVFFMLPSLESNLVRGEKRKYELGTSTLFNVVIAQRDATARALQEADAKNQYLRSQNALLQVLGKTLETYSVDIDEAKSGTVKREPDLIPAVVR